MHCLRFLIDRDSWSTSWILCQATPVFTHGETRAWKTSLFRARLLFPVGESKLHVYRCMHVCLSRRHHRIHSNVLGTDFLLGITCVSYSGVFRNYLSQRRPPVLCLAWSANDWLEKSISTRDFYFKSHVSSRKRFCPFHR